MPPRTDDFSLSNDELLYRRIWDKPDWINLKALANGELKPSAVAFLDAQNEVSVQVASMTTPEDVLDGFSEFGLVSIKAGVPRELDHIVAITPEEPDPSHRAICPPADYTKGKRKEAARRMADKINWVVLPASRRKNVREQNSEQSNVPG